MSSEGFEMQVSALSTASNRECSQNSTHRWGMKALPSFVRSNPCEPTLCPEWWGICSPWMIRSKGTIRALKRPATMCVGKRPSNPLNRRLTHKCFPCLVCRLQLLVRDEAQLLDFFPKLSIFPHFVDFGRRPSS